MIGLGQLMPFFKLSSILHEEFFTCLCVGQNIRSAVVDTTRGSDPIYSNPLTVMFIIVSTLPCFNLLKVRQM